MLILKKQRVYVFICKGNGNDKNNVSVSHTVMADMETIKMKMREAVNTAGFILKKQVDVSVYRGEISGGKPRT